MKNSISCSIQQHLALTPTLTQAIGLLQLSHHELQEEINRLVEKNPMLKVSYSFSNEQHNNFSNMTEQSVSLVTHLENQLVFMHFNDEIYQWGLKLIYSLDDRGFLSSSFYDGLPTKITQALKDWLLKIDPIGIGATSLKESLCWQLEKDFILKQNPLTPYLIDFIGKYDFSMKSLMLFKKRSRLTDTQMHQLKSLIGLLNFNPAQHYEHSIAQQYYQQPDLIVCKNNNKFEVHLNQDLIPSLHLDEVASYSFHQKEMKELVQQAKYLIKIVDTRFDTLIKTASLLVHHQQDFFVYGKAGLKTLILEDIAQQLGLHESTISRIIANKLIQTPLGIFELKSLLSRGLKKNSGEIVSTASVKEIILSLIQHECVSEPLSDQDIANTLNRQGFCIARRTVTKYRKQLDIQTSTQRKIH